MLELHDVTIKTLRQTLSLTVDNGQLVCLSGPRGAGKTTVLRAVMGLQPVMGGYISIDGELLTPLSASYFRKNMGYVPTRLVPIPGQDRVADVRKTLFGLSANRGTAAADPSERADDDRLWADLSPMEQYLKLMSCVVCQRRTLFLIDEPPVAIDGPAVNIVLDSVHEMMASGASVLMVNNQQVINYSANNVIILK
ncbi:MAG: ABC transporter ATP-binding protein [Prevotella sp.]|jgi:ABC-type cobalamin/Fe3+-siderophores transport system ATPase subunit|nr:ABC transporter ATP-binding protein [Prevotella sp.]